MPRSRQIVVDASVARSAGGETAVDPGSRLCRDALEAIRVSHEVVFSTEGWAEWRRHRSGFALKWLVRMESRRKVVRIGDVQDDGLRTRMAQLPGKASQRQAMEKDAHLLEAAVATDGIVISKERVVRDLFRQAAEEIQEIRSVLWANPVIEDEQVVAWLQDGARMERSRTLGGPG